MLRSAHELEWKSLELRLTGAGLMIKASLTVIAKDGSSDRRQGVDNETLAACDELREVMCQESTGTWYNALLTVDREGNFESEFDYENPPWDGKADPELLAEDQEEFPRDQEHLPDWHPLKSAG